MLSPQEIYDGLNISELKIYKDTEHVQVNSVIYLKVTCLILHSLSCIIISILILPSIHSVKSRSYFHLSCIIIPASISSFLFPLLAPKPRPYLPLPAMPFVALGFLFYWTSHRISIYTVCKCKINLSKVPL